MRKKRRKKIKNPENRKKIIYIQCEGKNHTEKIYLSGFSMPDKPYRLIFTTGNSTDPVGMIKDMFPSLEQGGFNPKYDQAFCLIDVDFPDRIRKEQLSKAYSLAKKNGITILLSNPTFEIWPILHFEYTSKPFSSNREVVNRLKQHIEDYDKSTNLFPLLSSSEKEAIENAQRLRSEHVDYELDNPSTEMDKLIEILLNES